MLSPNSQSKFGKLFQRVETKLVFFVAYVIALFYVGITSRNWLAVVEIHLTFVILFAFIYYMEELMIFLIAPLLLIVEPIQKFLINRYLKKFKQNTPTEVAIILGYPNWLTLEGWLKPIFLKSEIKTLVQYLNIRKQDFSFYPKATLEDVEKIMVNKDIKEVYFFGHGSSHEFQLGTDTILYYCDFNDGKYGKQFVHQVHCGKPHGKSLVDYIVPEANKAQCFMFRKPINSRDIVKEFKRKIKSQAVA